MWFRIFTAVSSGRKYLKLFCLMILLSSCEDDNQPPHISDFHTDGNIFVYTIADYKWDESIYISNIDGKLRKVFNDKSLDRTDPFVGNNNIYFASMDFNKKQSYLNSCSLEFADCKVIATMSGKISNPLEISDNLILFQRSPYNENLEHKFAENLFYIYNRSTNTVKNITTDKFLSMGPVIFVRGKYYFLGMFLKNLENDEYVRGRNAYSARFHNNVFIVNEEHNKSSDNYYIQFSYVVGNKNAYYIRTIRNKWHYLHQSCVLNSFEEQICQDKRQGTTYPIVAGNSIYYGILNHEKNSVILNVTDFKGNITDG